MKNVNAYIKILIVFIVSFVLTMCMTIENITHPDNPRVNSNIEIGVDVKLVPANDDYTKMIFAVLAPKNWNIADNAVLTITTSGYTKGDLSDEQMNLVGATETEPVTNTLWPTALDGQFGIG